MQKGGLMLQSIWCIRQKRIPPALILTSAFPRCHPISGGLPSSMRLEGYPLMKHGWNYGKKKGKEPESPGLCMKTMPCQFFTAEWCTGKGKREKMRHTWNCMTAMTGNGFRCGFCIQIWNISGRTGMGKRHLPQHWRKSTVNISCVFLIRRK